MEILYYNMKKVLTVRIEEETIAFVDHIAELSGIHKSRITALFIDMAQTYFTDEQLIMEAQMMRMEDGRTTRWKKDLDIEAGFPI